MLLGGGVDEVSGKTFSGILHFFPGPLEGLQNGANGSLLTKSSQLFQDFLPPLLHHCGINKGSGLLDAVQIKGDTSCGFCAKAKATQPLSLEGPGYSDIAGVFEFRRSSDKEAPQRGDCPRLKGSPRMASYCMFTRHGRKKQIAVAFSSVALPGVQREDLKVDHWPLKNWLLTLFFTHVESFKAEGVTEESYIFLLAERILKV